jgi:hypothetical protein
LVHSAQSMAFASTEFSPFFPALIHSIGRMAIYRYLKEK